MIKILSFRRGIKIQGIRIPRGMSISEAIRVLTKVWDCNTTAYAKKNEKGGF